MTSIDTMTSDLTRLAGAWTLDPSKTTIAFRTKAMWVLPVKGTAKALSGNAQIRPDGNVDGTLVIYAGSFDTRNNKRDDHLRSEDFLDVRNYPTIVFTANGWRPLDGDRVEITGVLTVHGQSRTLTLPAQFSRAGETGTVSTEVEIDRNLWGVSWAKMGASCKTQVRICAYFERT